MKKNQQNGLVHIAPPAPAEAERIRRELDVEVLKKGDPRWAELLATPEFRKTFDEAESRTARPVEA